MAATRSSNTRKAAKAAPTRAVQCQSTRSSRASKVKKPAPARRATRKAAAAAGDTAVERIRRSLEIHGTARLGGRTALVPTGEVYKDKHGVSWQNVAE